MSQLPGTIDRDLFFRALADRTRLRLLNLMGKDEVCVCFFVEILKTNQPRSASIWRTCAGLELLRAATGPWMHYRIVEPPHHDAVRILKDTLIWLDNDREMQRDCERLVKVCCETNRSEFKALLGLLVWSQTHKVKGPDNLPWDVRGTLSCRD